MKRLLIIGGIVLAIAGGIGVSLSLGQSNLASLVVTSPASGMVATAEGNGGAAATHIEAVTSSLSPIHGLAYVPTTPAVYLRPRGRTLNGRPDGSSPAFWKVWWDGKAQTKAAVSFQQSLTATDAQQGLEELSVPVGKLYPNESALAIPDIPGAFGYMWVGTDTSGSTQVPSQILAAMFRRGDNIALVSMKAYGTAKVDPQNFFAFAQAEYAEMSRSAPSTLKLVGFGAVGVVGVVMFVVAMSKRRPAPFGQGPSGAAFWPPPGQASGPASPYGGQPSWPPQGPASGPASPYGGQPSFPPQQPVVPAQGGYATAPGPAPVTAPVALPPAGWYPDPYAQAEHGQLRYWDGAKWTENATPSGAPAEEAPGGSPAP
jgi:hypothetical protein